MFTIHIEDRGTPPGTALGAVPARRQDDGSARDMAYISPSLQQHGKLYGITELEGLAS